MTAYIEPVARFADVAEVFLAETQMPASSYAGAFAETADQVRLGTTDEAISAEMPDPLAAQLGVEMLVTTLFDLLRDSRLEPLAQRLAWGIVHSFHKVADQLDGEADRAAMQVGRLIREQDGSEIATTSLEEAQALCHGLDEARDAVACMRDHAAAMFHAETGKPWSAPRATLVSGKRTASVISGIDFLAARRRKRIDAHAPDGPVVLFSGGAEWTDYAQLWERLDLIRARIPAMTLVTTAQETGCDAIAAAWAASRDVKLVPIDLRKWSKLGQRAGFARNEALMGLKPVEAIVCEGNGLQSHLGRLVRAAGVPRHYFVKAGQAAR